MSEPSYIIDPLRTRLEFEAAGAVIVDMLASMSGGIEQAVQAVARELGVAAHFEKLTQSRARTLRLISIETLGFMRLKENKGLFLSLIAHEADTEALGRAVLALSFIADEESDIDALNRVLKDPHFRSSKFSEYVYTNIIGAFRAAGQEERLTPFLRGLLDDPASPLVLKHDVIDACGSGLLHGAVPLIRDAFEKHRHIPDMKIVCIRALGRLGCADICHLISESLRDPDWRVRATAARNGHICAETLVGDLREALHDENYYVRINSAMALSRFRKGIEALTEELLSSDRFTRDMARYVLDEVRYHA